MSNKLWLPAGYAGKSISAPNGDCLSCRNTGAIFEGMRLVDPVCEGGKIISCTPEMDWKPCSCYHGQFWQSFHPINIQARLIHHTKPWHKVVRDELERLKSEVIRAAGGSYVPFQDTFLQDMGYKPAKQ